MQVALIRGVADRELTLFGVQEYRSSRRRTRTANSRKVSTHLLIRIAEMDCSEALTIMNSCLALLLFEPTNITYKHSDTTTAPFYVQYLQHAASGAVTTLRTLSPTDSAVAPCWSAGVDSVAPMLLIQCNRRTFVEPPGALCAHLVSCARRAVALTGDQI